MRQTILSLLVLLSAACDEGPPANHSPVAHADGPTCEEFRDCLIEARWDVTLGRFASAQRAVDVAACVEYEMPRTVMARELTQAWINSCAQIGRHESEEFCYTLTTQCETR